MWKTFQPAPGVDPKRFKRLLLNQIPGVLFHSVQTLIGIPSLSKIGNSKNITERFPDERDVRICRHNNQDTTGNPANGDGSTACGGDGSSDVRAQPIFEKVPITLLESHFVIVD